MSHGSLRATGCEGLVNHSVEFVRAEVAYRIEKAVGSRKGEPRRAVEATPSPGPVKGPMRMTSRRHTLLARGLSAIRRAVTLT